MENNTVKHYSRLQKSAKLRKKQMELSISQFKKLLSKKRCFYTGIKFDEDFAPSSERIDNDIGYVPGNVTRVETRLNIMKSDKSFDDLSTESIELKSLIDKDTALFNDAKKRRHVAISERTKVRKELKSAQLKLQIAQNKYDKINSAVNESNNIYVSAAERLNRRMLRLIDINQILYVLSNKPLNTLRKLL